MSMENLTAKGIVNCTMYSISCHKGLKTNICCYNYEIKNVFAHLFKDISRIYDILTILSCRTMDRSFYSLLGDCFRKVIGLIRVLLVQYTSEKGY